MQFKKKNDSSQPSFINYLHLLCYCDQLRSFCLMMSFFYNKLLYSMTTWHKPRHTYEGGISVVELPPSNWPVGIFVGHFLGFWLIREGPTHVHGALYKPVSLDWERHRKQTVGSVPPGSRSSSCLEFLLWLPSIMCYLCAMTQSQIKPLLSELFLVFYHTNKCTLGQRTFNFLFPMCTFFL